MQINFFSNVAPKKPDYALLLVIFCGKYLVMHKLQTNVQYMAALALQQGHECNLVQI